jgi:hypothetical protein
MRCTTRLHWSALAGLCQKCKDDDDDDDDDDEADDDDDTHTCTKLPVHSVHECAWVWLQDNEPLMRALSSLINVNAPNLVLFVGEALVGNDAVDQLVKFNRALHDLAPPTATTRHTIDGIVLTKFDMIDDKVCVARNV